MRLTNYTDIPTDAVREVVRFVCPPQVTNRHIILHNTARRNASGNAGGRRIMAKIPKVDRCPGFGPRGAYLGWPPHTRTEALILILAHELRHSWQAKVPRGRRVWGARGQFSERDADAYAIHMLRAWRRREVA